MARIIPPSTIRPLINQDLTPTDQTREFFNLQSQMSIESDGTPNGSIEPLIIGQICVDVTNGDAYINVDLTNTGWKLIT